MIAGTESKGRGLVTQGHGLAGGSCRAVAAGQACCWEQASCVIAVPGAPCPEQAVV